MRGRNWGEKGRSGSSRTREGAVRETKTGVREGGKIPKATGGRGRHHASLAASFSRRRRRAPSHLPREGGDAAGEGGRRPGASRLKLRKAGFSCDLYRWGMKASLPPKADRSQVALACEENILGRVEEAGLYSPGKRIPRGGAGRTPWKESTAGEWRTPGSRLPRARLRPEQSTSTQQADPWVNPREGA